jgi:hypothetical protein
MSLDDVVAELLSGPLNEFTNRRNAQAKSLKQAGQRELAAEVAALKKPPVAVWAVNQLARRDAAVLQRLRRAGEGVVQAQSGAVSGQKNAAPALRAASEGLQRELEAAMRAAGDILRTDGHAADEATMRRVQEMLRLAAVSGGDTWDRLQRGALISEPRAGEDMLTAAFAPGGGNGSAPARPSKATGVKASGTKTSGTKASEARAAREAARQAAETDKRIEMEHAQRTAKADEEAAQHAQQNARRLREEADRMTADAKRANEKARQAEKELERATAKAKASREAARRLNPRGK